MSSTGWHRNFLNRAASGGMSVHQTIQCDRSIRDRKCMPKTSILEQLKRSVFRSTQVLVAGRIAGVNVASAMGQGAVLTLRRPVPLPRPYLGCFWSMATTTSTRLRTMPDACAALSVETRDGVSPTCFFILIPGDSRIYAVSLVYAILTHLVTPDRTSGSVFSAACPALPLAVTWRSRSAPLEKKEIEKPREAQA
jgi:hypothetical protein